MSAENIGRISISITVVFAFLAYVYLILTIAIPPDMRDVVNTAGGLLGGAFMAVVGYWVGSSAGSSAKDKTITDLTNK
jgi:uncharacterized membrane protein YdjX (TVP38/TMEM64 family)